MTVAASAMPCVPVLDHALQGLSIKVVCDVKTPQHMQCELAEVHNMLMYMEGPDMVCIKHLLLAEW